MAGLYSPASLGITVPAALAGNGNWIQGRQIWNGQLSDPGVINPLSDQQGAGNAVSSEVNRQSDAAQGLAPGTIDKYIATQNNQPANGAAAETPYSVSGQGTPGGGTGTGGVGITPPASLNLPDLYKNLSSTAGIDTLEQGISAKTAAYNDAQSKINDNPFLSEANRTGRISKLSTDYNNSIANDNNTLAMKKQDVQTQIDLATKQFDINSQSATQALSQFNTLLSSGALAGASGNDIAAITAATGISSSMIQSAIKAQTVKDTPTSMTTVDDGKNIYAVVINTQTGQVINKQVIGASKPAAATASSIATANQQQWSQEAATYAASGVDLQTLVANFAVPGGLSVAQVYSIYNSNTKNGAAKETLQQAEQGVFANQKGFVSATQQSINDANAKKKASLGL